MLNPLRRHETRETWSEATDAQRSEWPVAGVACRLRGRLTTGGVVCGSWGTTIQYIPDNVHTSRCANLERSVACVWLAIKTCRAHPPFLSLKPHPPSSLRAPAVRYRSRSEEKKIAKRVYSSLSLSLSCVCVCVCVCVSLSLSRSLSCVCVCVCVCGCKKGCEDCVKSGLACFTWHRPRGTQRPARATRARVRRR